MPPRLLFSAAVTVRKLCLRRVGLAWQVLLVCEVWDADRIGSDDPIAILELRLADVAARQAEQLNGEGDLTSPTGVDCWARNEQDASKWWYQLRPMAVQKGGRGVVDASSEGDTAKTGSPGELQLCFWRTS